MGIQTDPPGTGETPANRRDPVDAWCDDGSVSRAEPPWLRDKRILHQLKKPKAAAAASSQFLSPGPHHNNNNPFDGASSWSDSSSSRRTPTRDLDRMGRRVRHHQPSNPFDDDATPPVTPRRDQPNPGNNINIHNTRTNPFDSSVEGTPVGRRHRRKTNPFDGSTVNTGSTGTEGAAATSQRPRIVRPSTQRPTTIGTVSSRDSAQDSLDHFLDTTDDTTVTTGEQIPTHRVVTPSSAVSQDGSGGSTPSDAARRAAESLRKSYEKTGRSLRASSPSTPVGQGYSEPAAAITPRSAASSYDPYGARQRPFSPGESARRPRASPRASPTFSQAPRRPSPTHDDVISTSSSTERLVLDSRLALHDLCDEARTTDDIAWRNALQLVAAQPHLASQIEPECSMTPLHVACLASEPPPLWMTRALLYTNPQQCQQEDSGGRLPLHLLVATTADTEALRLLVDEYPASVSHRDARGFTALQLLLKNDQISLTLEHLRILLGQTHGGGTDPERKRQPSFRRGEHLEQSFQDLQTLQRLQQEKHERVFEGYPDDVHRCLQKITQWKRRQINRGFVPNANSGRMARVYDNPAAIATPSGRLLPLHLLVRRPPNPLPQEVGGPKLADPTTLIRVLVAAHPEALVTTDIHGRTPLLTALLQSDFLPSGESLGLLLGLSTPGFASDPSRSPARLASSDTLQLPLHVAAEELAHDFGLLSTIAEAYPPAVRVQDARGRTPLHCALQNYRSTPLDEATFGLLLSKDDRVAKTLDGDGRKPLDLIVEKPHTLERFAASSAVVAAFLHDSIDLPRNPREERELMDVVRSLPPWLRRHASASATVQRSLLEELASPGNTALVLLQGGSLVALLVVLRIALDGNTDWDSWVLVNYFASYHLATQLLSWGTAWYLGEFYRFVLANGWRWIDLAASCCAIGTAYVVQTDGALLRDALASIGGNASVLLPADDDELVATLGAWATGLLWTSLLGFLVRWWCGMAVFVGSALELLQTLFWPFALAAMGIVAMSQVLWTLEDCENGNICGLEDAYTTVYWMILGEPILGTSNLLEEEQLITKSMRVVLIFFSMLWLWWLVSVVALVVSESQRLDRHQIALRWYWEPKVALTVMTRPAKEQMEESPSWIQRYCDFMEELWHVLSSSVRGGQRKRDIHWYACFLRPGTIILTRILAFILLPVWFLLGVATMGIMWPPQLRRWIFSTKIIDRKKQPAVQERLTAAKLSHLKGEIQQFQTQSVQQNYEMQKDLAHIKELLMRAMMEDE